MPQVIIHASRSIAPENCSQLVQQIRASIPELLNVPEHIGQVVLYQSPEKNRSTHPSRDRNFIVAEVMMYPGRTKEMKQSFLENLVRLLHKYSGVDAKDINCLIHKIPSENWSGGVSHKYIEDTNKM